jgi:hypothetical protein
VTAAIRRLDLRVDAVDDDPDDFVVTVLVDGVALFERPGDNGRIGPYPDEFTLPTPSSSAVRTLLATCACRNRGCEDLSAIVTIGEDVVSWTDLRVFTGWDDDQSLAEAPLEYGTPADLPDILFDRAQYLAELQRFSADRSWWTPRYTAVRVAVALHDAQVRGIER